MLNILIIWAKIAGLQADHHNIDDDTEPTYERKLFELPVTPLFTVYKTKWEHDAVELILE